MNHPLLIDPPFTKEEWSQRGSPPLSPGPTGPRLADYLCRYTETLVHRGGVDLDRLLGEAGVPLDSQEPLSLAVLRGILEGLACREIDYGVAYLEQLLVVNSLVSCLAGSGQVELDRATQLWAETCRKLAILVAMACIQRHFDIPAGGEQGARE